MTSFGAFNNPFFAKYWNNFDPFHFQGPSKFLLVVIILCSSPITDRAWLASPTGKSIFPTPLSAKIDLTFIEMCQEVLSSINSEVESLKLRVLEWHTVEKIVRKLFHWQYLEDEQEGQCCLQPTISIHSKSMPPKNLTVSSHIQKSICRQFSVGQSFSVRNIYV